jgi:hypothetical protein
MPARKRTSSSKSKGGKAKPSAAKVTTGKCGGWKAVLNMMPPGPSILRVTGKCIFPKHGFKVTLKEAVPQGINPVILLLKKTVKAPTGIVIPTPEVVNVTFTKKTKTKYSKVTILPDGVTINVQIVV